MILWGYTPSECEPYVRHRAEEIGVRKLITRFMTDGKGGGNG